jgi:hypothetical protein
MGDDPLDFEASIFKRREDECARREDLCANSGYSVELANRAQSSPSSVSVMTEVSIHC